MQGVIILGGNGTRLGIFSKRVTNKALALVYDRLVFEYPLNTLIKAGITDIVVVLGGRYCGAILSSLGDGREYGCSKVTYVYQNSPKGISDAINQSRGIIKDKCAVILGDNFFEQDITKYVNEFSKDGENGCRLFLKEVPDPQRFGVAEINVPPSEEDEDHIYIRSIIEKPQEPKTNLAVTGLYFYDNTLFDRIETLKPSKRGELEVTDLNMLYVADNKCKGHMVEGYWGDLGTYDSILHAANYIKNNNITLTYTIDAWAK